eukprot:COSAG02_NODE_896_length_16125_cov_5.083489_1_plen_100_part_00
MHVGDARGECMWRCAESDCMNAQVRNFRAKFRAKFRVEFRAKIGHFAPGHSTGRAKSGHSGTQPRTLWYLAQDTTAPDTLRECLAPNRGARGREAQGYT